MGNYVLVLWGGIGFCYNFDAIFLGAFVGF